MMYRNSRRNRSQRQNPGKRILNNSIQKSNRNRNRRPSTLVFSNSRLGVPTLEKKSCSDPELGGRSTIVGHFGGLPPGLTVDELSLYRRRRPPSHLRPQDNLHPEEGSLKAIKSEYRRRYITPPFLLTEIDHDIEDDHLAEILGTSEGSLVTAVAADRDGEHKVLVKKDRRRRRPEDELRLEGEVFFRPEYYEAYVDFPRQRPKIVRPRTHINSENHKEIPMDMLTEKNAQYVFFDGARRPELARRPTILHNEGEILVKESEIRSKYLPHEGAKKADLARRNTSLRMEGDMETKTEQKDKYITFSPGRRAELVKRRTQLTLEGEMDTLTENNEKYVYIASPKRVPFKKRPTNLRLEGEMEKVSENADKYVEFHEGRRSELMRRSTNLNLEGDLEHAPEYRDNYVDFPRERPVMRRPSTHLKPEGELHTTTEKSSQYIDYVSAGRRPPIARRKTTLSLEGEIESNPEYRESFVDFPRERPTISRRRTNLSLEGEMESKPEYKESFIDFPRERPRLRRQESSLKPQGVIETVTEKEAQYVPFLSSDTTVVVKRPPVNLRLEGEMHTTPEYRESYVDFPRERPVTKKPSGQLQSDSNASVLLASDPYKRPRGPGRPPESNFRSDGRIDSDPEYRSSYVDIVPRDKPITRRLCQRQTGGSKKADSRMTRSHSEKRYRNLSDIEDGYRRTYIDYTGRDRTPSRRRKPDNINFSGGTSLVAALSSPRVNRSVSASTRIVPPAGHHIAQEIGGAGRSRSKTVTFEIGDQRPRTCPWNDPRVARKQDTSNDSEDSFPVETGSDEPSFRLQVTNVDEVCAENDDFVRRRKRGRRRRASRSSPPIPILSRSIVSSRAPSPEGAIQFKVPVPVAYPLRQMEHNNNPAFVVLDDLNNNSHFSHATAGIQRTNFLDIPGKEQPHRGGTQRVNWMPPWSDAPTSI